MKPVLNIKLLNEIFFSNQMNFSTKTLIYLFPSYKSLKKKLDDDEYRFNKFQELHDFWTLSAMNDENSSKQTAVKTF